MPSFSPTPSSGGRVNSSPQNLGGKFFEAPRLHEKKEGYQVGLQGSLTGSRSRVSVVNSSTATPSTTGSAASFNGGYSLSIADGNQTGLDSFTSFSVEMWYRVGTLLDGRTYTLLSKLDSTGGYEIRVSDPVGAGAPQMSLLLRQGTFLGTVNTNYVLAGGVGLRHSPNRWGHVAYTYESLGTGSGTVNVYSNGFPIKAEAVNVGTITDSSGNFTLGSSSGAGTAFLGDLKEVRIWNTVRTAPQILEDMRNDEPSGGNLQGYWKLDGNSDDSSGNGNHLTTGASAVYTNELPFGTVYGRTQRHYSISNGEGFARKLDSGTWSDTRGAANAQDVNNSGDYGTVMTTRVNFPTRFHLYAGFIPIDTSAALMPAKNAFLGLTTGELNPTSSGTTYIVQTTQGNSGTLVVGDYSKRGDLNTPVIAGSYPISASGGTNRYTFVEFSNSLDPIQYGGTTFLGLRDYRDVENVEPPANSASRTEFVTSRRDGTLTGPFLDIIV